MAQAIRTPRFRERPAAEGQATTRSDLSLHPHHFRGRHHAATIFVVLVLAVVGFRLFPERDVTVLSNGQAFRASATFHPASEALAAASVKLEPGDEVRTSSGGRHVSIAVERARPVSVDVDGRLFWLRTRATTIAGALAEAGVELNPADRVYLDGRLATGRGRGPLTGVTYAARPVGASLAAPGGDTSGMPRITVVRARPVTVFVDTLRLDTASAAVSVDDLLTEIGMTVREGDLVRPALDSPLTAGMVVRLAKARTVSIKLDGQDQSLYTLAVTVADILPLLGVDPAEVDLLSPGADSPIVNGMSITIGRTRTIEEEITEAVPPRTVYESDTSLPTGTVKIISGIDGKRVLKYRVTYRNGVPVEGTRVLISSVETLAPVPTRRVEGAQPAAAGRPTLDAPGYSGPYKKKMVVEATWYNASHGGKERGDPGYGRTATGETVNYGICAVDPTVIPIHTRFYVEGYGPCVAEDTGGAIKGNIIDLGFPEDAGDPGWGRRVVNIFILD